MQNSQSNLFHFGPREKLGLLAVLFLILLTIAVQFFINFQNKKTSPLSSTELAIQNKWAATTPIVNNNQEQNSEWTEAVNAKTVANLFYFDPNTITKEQWLKLGVPYYVADNALKFLSKGGKFNTKEDVSKIYGLKPELYKKLETYIAINTVAKNDKPTTSNNYNPPADIDNLDRTGKYEYLNTIELNTADTQRLKQLNGIGSYYAQRIIKYRNALGGFVNIQQVLEIYNFPTETFEKIKPHITVNANQIKFININTCSLDDLTNHPYLKFSEARAIIAYREQHGAFTNLNQLQNIMALNENILQKIIPYLSL
jgi:competence protein ComEA